MKRYLFSLLALILVGCNPIAVPTQVWPASTATPISTSVPLPTAISTAVLSCEPVSNPFDNQASMDPVEYELGYYPNIAIARVCTLKGQVSRGQVYIHQITQDLVFCLIPGGTFADVPGDGWNIVISDSRSGSCDVNSEDYVNFGPVVTPPFRGNLWFDVYGWHFRNEENSGENDGSVNAPQDVRYFNFIFNNTFAKNKLS